jgi:hypothetical protein
MMILRFAALAFATYCQARKGAFSPSDWPGATSPERGG